MEFFLFQREDYKKLYGCDVLSEDEWQKHGKPNVVLGAFSIITGFIYLSAYIPCLIVISRKELLKHSCYKIMLWLGLLDCLSVLISCLISGFFSLFGTVACPRWAEVEYVIGAFAAAAWFSECATCVLLAFNRCVDLWRNKYLLAIFAGNWTYVWIGIMFIYFLCCVVFEKGMIFSTTAYAWFFDPYFGISEVKVDKSNFATTLQCINNIGVVALLVSLNMFLICSIAWKTRRSQSNYLSRMQKRITVQAIMVCAVNFATAVTYLYMQFVPTPWYFTIIGQVCWQLSSGVAPFIYLALNPTIRQRVAQLPYPRMLEISRLSRLLASSSLQNLEFKKNNIQLIQNYKLITPSTDRTTL
ncbi:hypothetical protein L596_021032 [Steinernema carpocapsae]|uniref:G-protein coupled receptors family 1 profile domain-containing protein n=1 Tax=Steinernema carpocapsae TaxID=34508 RepID=A0A4U5MV82_STECR|nr:hypothetical protein L596_021032 [Steinernema carpocapsae]